MKASTILKIALFATGLSGIVAEYTLSTLATYFLGDSVFQFTMIVSIMLFSMGLGSRLSQKFETNLLRTFVYLEFILSILVSFTSVIVYLVASVSSLAGFIIYFLSIVVGLLIGMEIPLVIRINNQYEELKVNVSSIMEKDYYGSLLGGVFFAFIGQPYLGLTYSPFLLGFINFSVAIALVVMLWYKLDKGSHKKLILLASFVFISTSLTCLNAENIIEKGEESRYTDKVIYTEQTPYQRIVMTENKNDFWLFLNGHQQLSSFDEKLYHDPLVHPVLSALIMPKNILVLGGGDGCAVREILKYKSVETITLVDLDPAVTKLAKHHPKLSALNENSLDNPKVKVLNQDGFHFMANNQAFYDAIIIDLPDPKTVELSRLYSFEFYSICRQRLKPNGLIITQAGSPFYASKAYYCIQKTMNEAGLYVLPIRNYVPTLGEWGWVIGTKNREPEKFKKQLLGLDFKTINTEWINQERMKVITAFGKREFIVDTSSIKVNKIHEPVLYHYYLNGRWDLY